MSGSGVRSIATHELLVRASGVTMGDASSSGARKRQSRRRVDADVGADSAWLPSFGDPPIVSYSQNAEDIRLWRVFRTIENGFYVDIGAAVIPGTTRSRASSTSMGGRGSMSSRARAFEALATAGRATSTCGLQSAMPRIRCPFS